MKNNCDVSGKRTRCTGPQCECVHSESVGVIGYCYYYEHGACSSTAAIRAAIESEKNNEK